MKIQLMYMVWGTQHHEPCIDILAGTLIEDDGNWCGYEIYNPILEYCLEEKANWDPETGEYYQHADLKIGEYHIRICASKDKKHYEIWCNKDEEKVHDPWNFKGGVGVENFSQGVIAFEV